MSCCDHPGGDRHRRGAGELTDQQAYWDSQAAQFDEAPDHGLRDPDTRAAWRELLLSLLPPPPADVLDVGCGTGTLMVLLAEAGFRVHGIDLSPRMVTAAQAKLAAAGVHATVNVADASEPPGAADAYDVVLSRHLLWALPDPGRAVRNWAQLLRPTGRLVLIEGRWHTGGGLSAAETTGLVRPWVTSVDVELLADPKLWGGPIRDERYVVVGTGPSM
jgi:SAM-dependent methyltransferase